MNILKSILFLWIAVLGIPTCSVAQQEPPEGHLLDHKPLINEVWQKFDLLMYKVEKKNGKTAYTPYFPPALKGLDGKTVQIQGYMIPIKSGFRHNHFLLSVLPIHQCMFCGRDGIPAMVEVMLQGNNKVRISDRPVKLEGKVSLNTTDPMKTEICIDQGHILTEG